MPAAPRPMLAGMFADNFEKFAEDNEDLLQHGPIV